MNPSEQEKRERNDDGSRADRRVQESIREQHEMQRSNSTNNQNNMRENPIGLQALAERTMQLGAQNAPNPDQATQRYLTNQQQQLGQPLALDLQHQLMAQNPPLYRAHQGSLPQHHEQNVARLDAAASGLFDVAHQVEQQLALNAARRAQLDHIDRLLAENAVQRFETEMALRNLQAQEYNSMQILPPLGLSASMTTATSNQAPLQQQQQQQQQHLYPHDEARLVSSRFPSNGHHDRSEVLLDKEAASSLRKADTTASGDNAAGKDDAADDDDSVSSLEESESTESSSTTTSTTTTSVESSKKKAADRHKRKRDNNSSDDDKKPAATAGASKSGAKQEASVG